MNMAGQSTMVGQTDLRRSDSADTVVTASGDELSGTLKIEQYTLDAAIGQVVLPAANVVGLTVQDPRRGLVQVGTTDGQVISGVLTSVPIVLNGTDGQAASIKLADVSQLAYRVSPEKPEEIRAPARSSRFAAATGWPSPTRATSGPSPRPTGSLASPASNWPPLFWWARPRPPPATCTWPCCAMAAPSAGYSPMPSSPASWPWAGSWTCRVSRSRRFVTPRRPRRTARWTASRSATATCSAASSRRPSWRCAAARARPATRWTPSTTWTSPESRPRHGGHQPAGWHSVTGELLTQELAIRMGEGLEMTVFPGLLAKVQIGRPPPATASAPAASTEPATAAAAPPARAPQEELALLRASLAAQKEQLAMTMAMAAEARAAANPEQAAELEKQAMDAQASLDKTLAQIAQLQKALAETPRP